MATSSVHQDAISTHSNQTKYPRCEYRHPKNNCPALGKQCYNCSSIGHFISLCKKPRNSRHTWTAADRAGPSRDDQLATDTAASCPAKANNHAEAQVKALLTHKASIEIETPHYIDMRLDTFLLSSQHHNEAEGRLLTETASNAQTSFHTTLQIITKWGTKCISVKVDTGAHVNTIPFSCNKKLFRKKATKAGHLKHNVLHPTTHLWS